MNKKIELNLKNVDNKLKYLDEVYVKELEDIGVFVNKAQEENDFASTYINSLCIYKDEIISIINDQKLEENEKQKKLGCLNTPFKQHGERLKYEIPKNIADIINKINEETNKKNPEDLYRNFFTEKK